ncbi:MAG TPA: hypothetical protein VFX03_05700, partial [Thermomicrobiales bacterium]|nr:hypothetical protein [Thermomicrobiales bacterium]
MPAAAADIAAPWLETADRLLQPKPEDDQSADPQEAAERQASLAKNLALFRAAAAFYKTQPDLASVAALTEKLIQEGGAGARVCLMSARAAEQARPELALQRYAAALGAVQSKSGDSKSGGQRPTTLYEQIVKPALTLQNRMPTPDAATKRALAGLFAAKGRL